jgi:Tol biopolymer transport system component
MMRSRILFAGLATMVVAICGCRQATITPPSNMVWAVGAPVGSQVALATSSSRDGSGLLWVVDASKVRPPSIVAHLSGDFAGLPVWSPDASMLAVAAGSPDDTKLQVVAAQTPARRAIWATHLIAGGWPQWSPDGQLLAWNSGLERRSEQDAPYVSMLRLADRRLLRLQLHQATGASFPHWSPDSSQISFMSGPRTHADIIGLFVIHSDGSGEKHAVRSVPYAHFAHAVWHDGQELIYPCLFPDGRGSRLEAWGSNVATGVSAREFGVTGLPYWVSLLQFQWDKHRRRVLVVASPSESLVGDIYLLEASENKAHRLTTDGRNTSPAWLLNDSQIAFVRNHNSLWTMKPDGSGQRQVIDVAALAAATRR